MSTRVTCPCGATLDDGSASGAHLGRFYDHHAACLERMSRPPVVIVAEKMTDAQADGFRNALQRVFRRPTGDAAAGQERG